MSLEKILIVEDDSVSRLLLELVLRRHQVAVTSVENLAHAAAELAKEQFDLVMLDLRLPDGDGLTFLETIAAMPDRPLVVIVTGFGTVQSAVACMRAGAFDYVIKPFSAGQIDVVLKKAESYSHLVKVHNLLSDGPEDDEGLVVGRSAPMQRLRQLIERVAPTDATVLITGESGTGKEIISREFYRRSPRRRQPFIKVNCAAVSQNLIESEFFGHERGAFSGATERREGRFELANNGTLLLDEVSEIPPSLQAKLLRVLQEREFERVGGSRTIKINVRVLATSNRDLLTHVKNGEFRQDLYYRLNVFPVHIPALREHMQDIPELAEHFLHRFVRKHGIKSTGFSDSARAALLSYRWPGNIRELQNTIERAVILSESNRLIGLTALGLPTDPANYSDTLACAWMEGKPNETAITEKPGNTAETPLAPEVPGHSNHILPLEQLEKNAIRAALRQSGGNRTNAAESLGITTRTLRTKLHSYTAAGDPIDAGPDSE